MQCLWCHFSSCTKMGLIKTAYIYRLKHDSWSEGIIWFNFMLLCILLKIYVECHVYFQLLCAATAKYSTVEYGRRCWNSFPISPISIIQLDSANYIKTFAHSHYLYYQIPILTIDHFFQLNLHCHPSFMHERLKDEK